MAKFFKLFIFSLVCCVCVFFFWPSIRRELCNRYMRWLIHSFNWILKRIRCIAPHFSANLSINLFSHFDHGLLYHCCYYSLFLSLPLLYCRCWILTLANTLIIIATDELDGANFWLIFTQSIIEDQSNGHHFIMRSILYDDYSIAHDKQFECEKKKETTDFKNLSNLFDCYVKAIYWSLKW